MSLFDLDTLLAPLGADAPCGPDLEYEQAFIDLELLAKAQPDRVTPLFDPSTGTNVEVVVPGKMPDHREVLPAALALFGRSKDLRIGMHLLAGATLAHGLPGFAEVTRLLLLLCQTQWEQLHPRLDPDDQLDPTLRRNILAGIAASDQGMRLLLGAPLAEARAVGRFCVRDLEVAAGTLAPLEGGAVPTRAELVAACRAGAPDEGAQRGAAVEEALRDLSALGALFEQLAGYGMGLDFAQPLAQLKRVAALYAEAAGDAPPASDAAGAAPAGAAPAAGRGAPAGAGAPASRAEASRLLCQACDMLEHSEPAHPAPLLVRRAIRLLDMNFLDLVRELTPDALAEVERLSGIKRE